ncbi:MAG: F0F1 ATP synthase subunit B [Candidatus Omnitrophica bacterium]|nr:F0F1 ATP synthase subunit B [Candidatus Omnitrophota bacterium]
MNLSLQEILTQALGFLILVWVMKRLFWKPILTSLDKRRSTIEEAFRQIENSKKEIDSLRRDYESHLAKIEEEAHAKIQAAIDEGRRISREIQAKSREEAKEALLRSRENLALEIEKARIELRREIADLTLLATEKLLREKMTEDKQREKILEMIEELEGRK